MNIAPQGNVQIATIAGFISVVIEHLCKANNIIIPDDISAGLPGVVALGVAWVCDIVTDMKAQKAIMPAQQSAAMQPKQ